MNAAFGVHVGNSSACIAVSREGKTDVVANDAGDRVTPAMVSFADNEIVVGLAAKQGRIRNINNTIRNNKLFIAGTGSDEDAAPVTLLRSGGSGSSDNGDGGGNLAYEVDFRDKAFHVTPPRILQHIYRYMHDIAASHCTNVDESNTVITVPLAFTEDQRRTVADAAAAAGFRVLQVVNEPVAACLAHGLEQVQDRRHILVYRVGGLTMTASLLLLSGGCYTVLGSVDRRLGGEDVTEVLVNYLGKEFRTKYQEDILKNKRGRAKLALEAEKVKHVLSTLDTAHCFVESLFDGMDFSTNVTRARFDNEISKVVSDLLLPISELLSSCKLAHSDIAHVVLVGGTTKVVKIQKQLGGLFPDAEIHANIPPDESIAVGAAVQASLLTKEVTARPREMMLAITRDIFAISEELAGGRVLVLPADSTLPARRTVLLEPRSGCTRLNLQIVVAPEHRLATLQLDIQENSKPSLGLHIHRDGTTHVTLTDKTSGQAVDALIKPAATAAAS